MPKKGNGYTAAAAVATALEKSGLQPKTFFQCASRFGKSKPLDPSAEADRFVAWQSGGAPKGYTPHPIARAMADWILTADPRNVSRRIQSLSIAQ